MIVSKQSFCMFSCWVLRADTTAEKKKGRQCKNSQSACREEGCKSLIRFNWQVRSLTSEGEAEKVQREQQAAERERECLSSEKEKRKGGRTVRIHAVLASPQQLHQYCTQLRTWQRSSVLHFQRKRATPTTGQPSGGGALWGAEYTHSQSLSLSLSLEPLLHQEAEEASEGRTHKLGILQRREPILERDCKETMLLCSTWETEDQGVWQDLSAPASCTLVSWFILFFFTARKTM